MYEIAELAYILSAMQYAVAQGYFAGEDLGRVNLLITKTQALQGNTLQDQTNSQT